MCDYSLKIKLLDHQRGHGSTHLVQVLRIRSSSGSEPQTKKKERQKKSSHLVESAHSTTGLIGLQSIYSIYREGEGREETVGKWVAYLRTQFPR
jgi:hypothetical protein